MTLARSVLLTGCCWAAALGQTPAKSLHPQVHKAVAAVSTERISEILRKLERFETRNTFSAADDPARGIGAARRWIAAELRGYSPRLEVSADSHLLKKAGRIFRDVEVVNIVAVLPGKRNPARRILMTGHYDSLNNSAADPEQRAAAPAPGANDDGSGTAAVIELARVMSRFEWDNTIVFVAFAAEEYGLAGSRPYAQRARRDGEIVEAVLNCDIIGTEKAGDGTMNNRAVRVYSDDPADSPSRSLARYVRDHAARYVPEMKIELVFLRDRFGRGGDHTSFANAGFAGVRFTSAVEDYTHQHRATDTLANMSPSYTALVAKVNAAVLGNLALAPAPPVVTRMSASGRSRGRVVPALSRGKSGYDAHLSWTSADASIAGFAVVERPTVAPFWEKEVWVGNVKELVLRNTSIDDRIFGVKAVGTNGIESLVSPYLLGPAN